MDTTVDSETRTMRRLHTLWRVCREHARLKGLVSPSETLKSRLSVMHFEEQRQLWHVPTSALHTSVPHPLLGLFDQLPIFPDTPANEAWRAAMTVLGEELGIDPDRIEDALNHYGSVGPWEIEQWEETLVNEAIDHVSTTSFFQAARTLARDYSLTHIEASSLIYLGRAEMTVTGNVSVDEARAIMNHRLERLFAKANKIGDINTALRVLKVQAVVQGLTRGEVDDVDKDFRITVKEVATKQESLPRISGGA